MATKKQKRYEGETYTSVFLGRLQQLLEILVAFHILIASLPPLGHGLAMEDQNMKEAVK